MNQTTINGKIFIDGREIPTCPSKSNKSNVTMVNDHVYMNGYEYKNGKWKRTIKAFLYNIF